MSKARQLADLGNQVDDGAITGSNMVVNGGMTVAQRGVSFTGLTNTAFTLDRFQWQTSTGPTVTIEQSTDAPVGFYNSLKVTVTTTDTMAAGDYDAIYQPIEGLNFSHLGFGASGAKQFTLSFWAKASVTGTYSVNLINSSNDRTWTGSYSVNTASTWEYKTIVVDGDTSGTWLATSGVGLKVWFSLGSGSNYQAASTSSAWSSGVDLGLTGAVDLRTTSGATFQITGVCLNVGDSAIDFPHESYGDTLAKCKRYFEQYLYTHATYEKIVNAFVAGTSSSNDMQGILAFSTKRTAPSITLSAASTFRQNGGDVADNVATSVSAVSIGRQNFQLVAGGNTRNSGMAGWISREYQETCFINFDAEL